MQYDLIVVGSGAAGYSAAIYASRYNINTLVIGKDTGGMAATAHKIDNYPGIKSISGLELMQKFADHTKSFGVEIKQETIKAIKKQLDGSLEIITDKTQYQTTNH